MNKRKKKIYFRPNKLSIEIHNLILNNLIINNGPNSSSRLSFKIFKEKNLKISSGIIKRYRRKLGIISNLNLF